MTDGERLLPTVDDPARVIVSDALSALRRLPDNCVSCCVTSPPYWNLRNYQVDGQIGLEKTPEAYVARLVEVFREVRRVLTDTGCLWLNVGDCFSSGGRSSRAADGKLPARGMKTRPADPPGCKPKDLIGVPWMLAFALRADGWYLRQRCPWVKRNPMCESVSDRPGSAVEEVFLLSKSARYYFDMEAVKRPVTAATAGDKRTKTDRPFDIESAGEYGADASQTRRYARHAVTSGDTRNFRNSDLWFDSVGMLLGGTDEVPELLGLDVTPEAYKGAHFACWPTKLVRPLIESASSARGVCPACFAPWQRVVEKKRRATRPARKSKVYAADPAKKQDAVGKSTCTGFNERCRQAKEVGNRDPQRHVTATSTLGWEPTCECVPPAGSNVEFVPHASDQRAEAGVLAEQIAGTDGSVGWHILAALAGDPQRTVRVWEADGRLRHSPVPPLVLDPFAGSGTTLAVAVKLKRRAIGVELNPDYARLAEKRLAEPLGTGGLFASDVPVVVDLFTHAGG